MKKFLILLIFVCGWGLHATAQNNLKVSEDIRPVLTHLLVPSGPVPTALDPNGVYPYTSFSETSKRPVIKNYRFIMLENDHIKATICPDLGGKVYSLVHKTSGKEVLYVPGIIRPTRILPRFYFIAGGIEVSFPISHSPSQNETLKYQIDRRSNRYYVTCGERELRFGMQWSVEYSLGPNDKFLTQRVKYHNPGTKIYSWMSWSNAALPSAPDTKFNFPLGEVLLHSSVVDTIQWETKGPETEEDISEMTGYFWRSPKVNAFGAYTPSLGSGLYHIADKKIAPGMKLWSYGRGIDSSWATLSTAGSQAYIEIQGGPLGDQSVRQELKPGETRSHVEYWFPSDKEIDIYSLKLPSVPLRNIDELPLFGWARLHETEVWLQLTDAQKKGNPIPVAPGIELLLWAPSGMENLDDAFYYAIQKTRDKEKNLWLFH